MCMRALLEVEQKQILASLGRLVSKGQHTNKALTSGPASFCSSLYVCVASATRSETEREASSHEVAAHQCSAPGAS